ncbi:alpha/beta hydrolase [Mycobacterium kyorinense]|uniref:alpha/beta hydrolase n=1 Tax=Mycobacterium kyorinense TaxID=487514 RepID=UPI0009ECDF6D|nr:alpha/beta hydrolase [Mycobacterium kyorinense]
MSTWSDARSTLGSGAPQEGTAFDRSTQLRWAQSGVESAAPTPRWTGTAADAYAEANSAQGRVLGQLAVLDQRLGAEVDRSAAVVSAGRQTLDGVKQWVLDAAASVPSGADHDRALMPITRKGIRDVAEVIRQVDSDLNLIGARIRTIGREYQALGAKDSTTTVDDSLSKPLPQDPKQFHDFWVKLSSEQQDRLYCRDHSIGNHPGMPFVDKDKYNRQHLDVLTTTTQADVNRMQHRVDELARQRYMGDHSGAAIDEFTVLAPQLLAARHRLEGYRAVQTALVSDGPTRYLGLIDDRGHAAVSIGEPDNAKRNATFVPGTGEDLPRLQYSDERSCAMYNAALHADPSLQPGDVAVTTWMGYDRPMDVTHAASADPALAGAEALGAFESGMRASHVGPSSIDTVIGHSYGSTLVGAAASGGHHLDADNMIAVGSPGVLVDRAADLNLAAGAQVYATRAVNDIIELGRAATEWTLGGDPTAPQFGATLLEADPGPAGPRGLPGVAAHSSYWSPGKKALYNFGAVIASVPPPYLGRP